MQRREFLARLGAAYAVSLSLEMSPWCRAARAAHAPPVSDRASLTEGERQLLAVITEGMLPKTDTPGAIEAGVPEFIALLYAEWFDPAEQDRFRASLRELEADAMQRRGKGLRECSAREIDALLREWLERAQAPRPADEPAPYFTRLRELAIIAFCTSEVGQSQVLEAQFGAGQNTEAGPVIKPPPFRL